MRPAPPFALQTDLLAFADQSVAPAQRAFDGFIAAARQVARHTESTAATAQTGAKDMAQLAMSFAERNIASSFELAQKLVRAKDPKEVVALQSEYMKQQMETLAAQAKELGQRSAKMAGGKS